MEVQDMVFDLMASLEATDDQLDFVTLFGSAKRAGMSRDVEKPTQKTSPPYSCDRLRDPCSATAGRSSADAHHLARLQLLRGAYRGRTCIVAPYTTATPYSSATKTLKPHREGKVKELYTFEGIGKGKSGLRL